MRIILSEVAKRIFPNYVVKNRAIIIEPTSYIYRTVFLNGSSSGHRRLEVFAMSLFSPYYFVTLELSYLQMFNNYGEQPSLWLDPEIRESNIEIVHDYLTKKTTHPWSPAEWLMQIEDPQKFLEGLLKLQSQYTTPWKLYSIACSNFLCGNISECLEYFERMKEEIKINKSSFNDKLLVDVGDKLHLVEDDPDAFTKFLQQTCFEMAAHSKLGIKPRFD